MVTSSVGYCQKCGKSFEKLDCSHIKSVGAYPNLRFDIMNVIAMCSRCHLWWWHEEPTESGGWFKNKFPGRYAYLQLAKNRLVKRTKDDLKEIRKHIKEKNVKKLVIAPEIIPLTNGGK